MLSSLVAGFGSSSFTAYRVVNSRLDTLRETFAKQPDVSRDVDYLRQAMPKIESVDDLLDDPRLMRITTTAFGLEENAFAKGFFKKLLSEDSTDANSLARRMVDPRYKDMVSFMEFDTKGTANMKSGAWMDKLVGKYLDRAFENEAGAANPAVQDALYFQRKASEVESYYDILGDKTISEVVRGSLGLPAEFSSLDVDRQVATLKSKIDLEDFKNPTKVSRMIDRHLAISDAQNMSMGNSPTAVALQTFSAGPLTGFGPIVAIDPTLTMLLKK